MAVLIMVSITTRLLEADTLTERINNVTFGNNSIDNLNYWNTQPLQKKVRKITNAELNGNIPIQLGLNEKLYIPMEVPFPRGSYIMNNHNVEVSTVGSYNVLDVAVANISTQLNFNSNMEILCDRSDANLDFSVLCDPINLGATIVSIDCIFEKSTYSKKLNIYVVTNSK
jgi:hypothetical protein